MSNRTEYCPQCGAFYIRTHECAREPSPEIEKLHNDERVIVAAIETLEYQIKELAQQVSREQLRCWNIRIQRLRSQRIAIREKITRLA